jgi:hypothetical protein
MNREHIRFRFWRLYYEAHRRFVIVPRYTLQRYARALAYARGRLTPGQAQSMVYDIEHAAGWYHLVTLDVEYVMEQALERWQPHPELRALVDEACDYVGSKFEDHNDVAYHAKGWALDKVQEWAKEHAIILEPTEDWADLVGTFAPQPLTGALRHSADLDDDGPGQPFNTGEH